MGMRLRMALLMCLAAAAVFTGAEAYRSLRPGTASLVPEELYEAAEIDGANAFSKFIHVTIPNIKEMILVDSIIIVVGSFKLFDEVFIMTNGGPGYASEVLSTYLYRTAFRSDQMGSASAIAVVLFVITFALSLIQMRISRTGEE